MRLLLCLLCLTISLPLCLPAQETSLDQPLGFTLPELPLPDALRRIEQATEWRFSYSPQDLPATRRVALRSANQSLRTTMNEWLRSTGLSYRLIGGQVVIFREREKSTKPQPQPINGYVREAGSREPLPYARIVVAGTQRGTLANQYGYFVLNGSLPLTLTVSHLGHRPLTFTLTADTPLPLDLTLSPAELNMDSVEITSAPLEPVNEPGRSVLGPDFIASVPTFLGERDVVKALQYLPGVQRANDGNSSLYVRGGNGDQNLILLDEAPVYNVNHLFGFFSVFNGDAVQSVEFIKGGFPAHYGGRISSVLSITTREGSREKWGAQGGIGITSSRVTVDGPILGKKGSLLLSARRSYWDAVVRPILDVTRADTKPFFYFQDFNAKLTYDLSERDKLIGSFYHSRDRYGELSILGREDAIRQRNGFAWQNFTGNLRWNRVISPRAFMNTSLFMTSYGVNVFTRNRDRSVTPTGYERLSTGSQMLDLALKHDFYWYPNERHQVRWGGIVYQHWFTPNRLRVSRRNFRNTLDDFDAELEEVERYPTQEAALYLEDRWRWGPRWELEAGFRVSAYQAVGQFWATPEPRIKVRFQASDHHQLEASATHMAQYIHQISNTGLALPIDVWIPSTDQIRPQRGWQGALGWTQRYPEIGLQVLAEAYYKTLSNVVGYREGGGFIPLQLFQSDVVALDWQNLVVQGEGEAYGLELMVDWQRGPHQAKLSYAWSRTLYQFEELNRGQPFAPRQDRRHMLSLLYQWQISPRLTLNAGWFLATGNPIPLPLSQTYLAGHREVRTDLSDIPELNIPPFDPYFQFSGLDEYRTPLYHRLDASLKIQAKDKPRRWNWDYYWELGAFNVYNRLNPTFYSLENDLNELTGEQVLRIQKNSLFFLTPSVSFNFEF